MDVYNWLILAFLSMVPFWESRYTIPIGITQYGFDPLTVYIWCCAFNILAILIIYFCLDVLYHRWLCRIGFISRTYDWCVKKVSSKEKGILEKWQEIGLIIFVAIPVPATGVWTGTLLAWLFELEFKKSVLVLSIGVLISSAITTTITLGLLSL